MEPSCSKIVSLHMERCMRSCPHEAVCYHRRKVLSNGRALQPLFREDMLRRDWLVYDSLCSSVTLYNLHLLTTYPNYHITLPYDLYSSVDMLPRFRDQLQITIYDRAQARRIPDHQKLFLIKDTDSWNEASRNGMCRAPYRNIHFVIDQDFGLPLKDLIAMINEERNITLDSCLTSWLINGRCPYSHGNYIDISSDWTVRTCPFNIYGIPISGQDIGESYEGLFMLRQDPEKCIYSKIWDKNV